MANITVQVVYALPQAATLLTVTVLEGATIAEVLQQSQIFQQFPELAATPVSVGIFGRKVALTDKVTAGDRVEIYRPLIIDPKSARVKRVTSKKRLK